jgi:hypothetical protein
LENQQDTPIFAEAHEKIKLAGAGNEKSIVEEIQKE